MVVNPSLMDNHQLELAEAMYRRSFCAGWPALKASAVGLKAMAAEPKHLRAALAQAAHMEMQPYPAADLAPWHKLLEVRTA